MKDLGEAKSFLGIKLTRNHSKRTITLSQKGYIETILERFGFTDAKLCWTPMADHPTKCSDNTEGPNPRIEVYQSIIKLLIYLMIVIQPDVTSTVGIVSRYLSNLSEEYLTATKYILCYVKGTKEYSLMLGPSLKKSFKLYKYTDTD